MLFLSGLVPDLVGPCVLRSTPGAARLNKDVVHTLTDSEETLLTPVGAPRVTYIPVLFACLLVDTPAND